MFVISTSGDRFQPVGTVLAARNISVPGLVVDLPDHNPLESLD